VLTGEAFTRTLVRGKQFRVIKIIKTIWGTFRKKDLNIIEGIIKSKVNHDINFSQKGLLLIRKFAMFSESVNLASLLHEILATRPFREFCDLIKIAKSK